jgi:hypothetical protein
MKLKSPLRRVTAVHFRERARLYRLAAAIAAASRDAAMFRELAMMFKQLAEDFARAETTARSI